jgi:hypothetical protein
MGANEKVWIEGFRRNLAHVDGETSMRPSAATAAELRTLMNDFDPAEVYPAVRCPALAVLATRNLPQQEPFADLYEAHRRYLTERVAATGVPHLVLADASHAMVIEQPELLSRVIGDFLQG